VWLVAGRVPVKARLRVDRQCTPEAAGVTLRRQRDPAEETSTHLKAAKTHLAANQTHPEALEGSGLRSASPSPPMYVGLSHWERWKPAQ
jgi:hypothetical protein